MRTATILALLLSLSLSLTAAEVLTNADVVKLVVAGFEAQTIEQKIAASDARFDLSTEALIELKSSGVPERVVRAMMAKSAPTAPAPHVAVAKPVSPVPTPPTRVAPVAARLEAQKATTGRLRFEVTLMKSRFGGCAAELTLDGAGVKVANCHAADFTLTWSDVKSLCTAKGAKGVVRIATDAKTYELKTALPITAAEIGEKAQRFAPKLAVGRCE